MEILIQQYGALGIGIVILFQIFSVQTRILKIEVLLSRYKELLDRHEERLQIIERRKKHG